METIYTKNDFIITLVKGTNKCYQSPSMGWIFGYPQMSSSCVESLSSIMCKSNKIMVCNNEKIRVTTVSTTMKIIKSE